MSRFAVLLAVLLTGAIALGIVARAALVYRGSDPLAFGLVLLIGLGLVLGTIELLARATRAIRLQRELAALPRPATREAVSAASPMLRGLLEARIGGAQGVSIAAPFTPYLLGLLVMIGLLGTFLGLFETLRGAREALGASGDVAALRAGLAAPMTGLSRAFGTSAAGVSASAMLGLGAVFVRRTEAHFVNALGRYATGPLSLLTLAGRQLAALEALVRQSEALPAAAASLAEATRRLTSLEERLLEAQAKSSAEAAAAMREAASASTAATREAASASTAAMREAASASTAAMREAASASATALCAAASDTATAIQGAFREAASENRLATSASTAAIRASASEIRADLSAGIERAAKATSAVVEPLLREALVEVRRDLAASALEVAAQGSAFGERVAGVAALIDRLETGAGTRFEGVAGELRATAAGLAESSAAQAAQLAESNAVHAARLAESSAAQIARLAESSAAQAAQLAESSAAQAARLEAFDRAASARAEHAEARLLRLADLAEVRLSTLGDQAARADKEAAAHLASFAERAAQTDLRAAEQIALLAAQVAEGEARAGARLDALIQASERVLLGQGERLAAFEQRLEGSRGASAEALADKLAGFARGLGEELGQTASLVREASDLLRAGGAEMASVAEMFTGAVDRYRDASDRWLGNLGAIEDAIARKDGGGADGLLGAYLDQTREVFDHSLQFQRELFLELRALKSKTS